MEDSHTGSITDPKGGWGHRGDNPTRRKWQCFICTQILNFPINSQPIKLPHSDSRLPTGDNSRYLQTCWNWRKDLFIKEKSYSLFPGCSVANDEYCYDYPGESNFMWKVYPWKCGNKLTVVKSDHALLSSSLRHQVVLTLFASIPGNVPYHFSLSHSYHVVQWFSKYSPWTASVRITWEAYLKCMFPGRTRSYWTSSPRTLKINHFRLLPKVFQACEHVPLCLFHFQNTQYCD